MFGCTIWQWRKHIKISKCELFSYFNISKNMNDCIIINLISIDNRITKIIYQRRKYLQYNSILIITTSTQNFSRNHIFSKMIINLILNPLWWIWFWNEWKVENLEVQKGGGEHNINNEIFILDIWFKNIIYEKYCFTPHSTNLLTSLKVNGWALFCKFSDSSVIFLLVSLV